MRDQLGKHLGVARRLEANAALLEFVTQHLRIREVSVVGDRDGAELRMLDEDGLRVLQPVRPGGGVSRVPQCQVAGQALERLLVEGLRDQAHVLVQPHGLAITGGDPGALLPAVLQGIEPEIGQVGHVLAGRIDAKEPTLLVHPLIGHWMAPVQNAVSHACRKLSRERRMSDPTWKSSPPTTPTA